VSTYSLRKRQSKYNNTEKIHYNLQYVLGCAVAQAVSRWLPTAAARVCVRAACEGFVVDKAALGRFSQSTSVSPANHSTNFSIIIIIHGWHSGRSAEWTQLVSTPKFSEKNCPSATFVHHKMPHDQTRVWTLAAAVGSRRLTCVGVYLLKERIYCSKANHAISNTFFLYFVKYTRCQEKLCYKFQWDLLCMLHAKFV
jgi:hypothetical protein